MLYSICSKQWQCHWGTAQGSHLPGYLGNPEARNLVLDFLVTVLLRFVCSIEYWLHQCWLHWTQSSSLKALWMFSVGKLTAKLLDALTLATQSPQWKVRCNSSQRSAPILACLEMMTPAGGAEGDLGMWCELAGECGPLRELVDQARVLCPLWNGTSSMDYSTGKVPMLLPGTPLWGFIDAQSPSLHSWK